MTPELILLAAIMMALTLYAVLGGADFGAGVWEFNTAFRASPSERRLTRTAMGPVWEANHVWLIFVVVAMFGAFPAAFAALCRALWLPLHLALLGIVFRGVGFVFQAHSVGAARQQALWGAVFALASTASPFFLGACLGAVASGKLEITAAGEFTGDPLTGWVTPLSIFTAFFSVGTCAYLAAAYLVRDAERTGQTDLAEKWRRRAIACGVWVGFLSFVGLAVVAFDTPEVWDRFRSRAWPLVGLSVVTGLGSIGALWKHCNGLARVAAAATVAAVVWGWGVSQYPVIVPPEITIDSAKSPERTLWALVGVTTAAVILVLPALGFLLYLFKAKNEAAE
jgi:cytochrome d ubiquinol oxidase subunit II